MELFSKFVSLSPIRVAVRRPRAPRPPPPAPPEAVFRRREGGGGVGSGHPYFLRLQLRHFEEVLSPANYAT